MKELADSNCGNNVFKETIENIAKRESTKLDSDIVRLLLSVIDAYFPNADSDWLFGDNIIIEDGSILIKFPTLYKFLRCLRKYLKQRYTNKPDAAILLPERVLVPYEDAAALFVEYLSIAPLPVKNKLVTYGLSYFNNEKFLDMRISIVYGKQLASEYEFISSDFFTLEEKRNSQTIF